MVLYIRNLFMYESQPHFTKIISQKKMNKIKQYTEHTYIYKKTTQFWVEG